MRVIAMLALIGILTGCYTVQAQEPPKPEPLANTESVLVDNAQTPTPTHPVEIACGDFTNLVHFSWWAMVDDDTSKILTREATQGWLAHIKKGVGDYPPFERAATAVILAYLPTGPTYLPGAGFDSEPLYLPDPQKFQGALLGARQFDRLCGFYGYPRAEVHPDVLVEHICSGRVTNP